jgi:hypothetical protein
MDRIVRMRFVSLAVGVLAITSVAGIVSAGEADAMKERDAIKDRDRKLIEKPLDAPAQETDSQTTKDVRLQMPGGLRVETDEAMERSSRALREVTTERGKKKD